MRPKQKKKKENSGQRVKSAKGASRNPFHLNFMILLFEFPVCERASELGAIFPQAVLSAQTIAAEGTYFSLDSFLSFFVSIFPTHIHIHALATHPDPSAP